jgi:TPR repeat protein
MLTPAGIESLKSSRSPRHLYRMGQAIFENADLSQPSEVRNLHLVWKAALDCGDLNAMYSYAQLLQRGEGFAKADVSAATKYFKQLTDARHPWGTYAYAEALLKGDGTQPNANKAFDLFLLCAKSGLPPAFMAVANMYAAGTGVSKVFFRLLL